MAEILRKGIDIRVRNIREFNLPYWEISSGKEGPCLLITAALHGNEVNGCEVMRRFCPVAGEKLTRGKILMLPFANPPALWNRRHHVYSKPCEQKGSGQDNINRAWPGNPAGHEIEQLAFIIHEALVKQATHNIDMHCWERFYPTAALVRDSEEHVKFARAAALPVLIVKEAVPRQGPPPSPCTLSNYFNCTGRVAFTVEFSGQYVLGEREINLGLRMLDNCSKYLGMFEGQLEGMDEPFFSKYGNTEEIKVEAHRSGLFVESGLYPGDFVKKGDLLGTLFSDETLESDEVRAPAEGCLLSYGCRRRLSDVDLAAMHPYAEKGDSLAVIAGSQTG